jgi:mannosylfructose-phosphate synthase
MPSNTLTKIAMLSTHGHLDPVPILGQTDTGGQVVYVLELAKSLSKKGIKVDIFTRKVNGSKLQKEAIPDFPDVSVIRINAGPQEFISKEHIYGVLPELAENIIDYISKHNLDYDLFHAHYVDAGIVGLDVTRKFSKPLFFTAHSLGAWKRERMGGDNELMEEKYNFDNRIKHELEIFKKANAQTVTSRVQYEKINQLYDFYADNIVCIPPGVDVETYKPNNGQAGPSPPKLPKKYIYSIGRIDANKGHDFLIKAFNIVQKQIPDVNLVIGGGSPNPSKREKEVQLMIKKKISEFGIENRVHIIGYVPYSLMATYYQKASIFVLPSLFEPFGMTIQEAMACGIPVIASRFGGIRTVIDHGTNGMLVDPSDSSEFANAMLRILNDDKLHRKLGHEAYNTVQREFSWEAIADRFIKCYLDYI